MESNEMHIEHSEQIAEFAAAFVIAQAAIEGAVKDATNPHYKSKYADLSSVSDACKGPLNANGIGIIQAPVPCEQGKIALETMLLHKSGQWMRGRAEVPLPKNDPQGYGSAMTYARRYSLAAMAGVCPEDDDAEAATPRNQSNGNRQQRPPQRQQQPTNIDAPEAALIHLHELIGVTPDPAKAEAWIREKAGVATLAELSADQVASFTQLLTERAKNHKATAVK